MKTRSGFISNSSSCSFVIHRSYLTDTQIKKMETLYDKLTSDEAQESENFIYDENGTYFRVEKNYIGFNAYSTPKEWDDLIKSLKLPEGAIFSEQG